MATIRALEVLYNEVIERQSSLESKAKFDVWSNEPTKECGTKTGPLDAKKSTKCLCGKTVTSFFSYVFNTYNNAEWNGKYNGTTLRGQYYAQS